MTDENVNTDVQAEFDLNQLDPDSLPTDPEALIKLLGGAQTESPEPDELQDEDPAETASSPEAVKTEEDEEAPVLSADGKHAIPFAVLKQEREAKRALAEQNAQLQRELEMLQQAKASGTPVEAAVDMDDPELKAFEEEFPELAKANAKMRVENLRLRQEVDAQRQQVQEIAAHFNREREAKLQQDAEMVNAAIDANPVLRYLRSEEGDTQLWEAAVAIDSDMQVKPKWKNASVEERFAAVVARLEEDYGPVKVPAAYQSPVRKPAAKPVQKEELTINTLSDLRGGSSPEATELSESMSTIDLQNHFLNMDPAQLARLDPEEFIRRMK